MNNNFISKVSSEHFLELLGKKDFVERIGYDCGCCRCGSIIDLTYEVFEKVNTTNEYIQEYLVVTYRGGSKTYRSCNMNSLSAILREIGKLSDGGYYDELVNYKNISTSEEWVQII
jgi:hypothetical protein